MKLGFVYIVGAALSDEGPVKIGYTEKSVDLRVAALQVGSPVPLSVIAAIRGTPESERNLHRICKEYRLHGEWFERKGAVCDVIKHFLVWPDSLNSLRRGPVRVTWVPQAVDFCPGAHAIWTCLWEAGVSMRAWGDKVAPIHVLHGDYPLRVTPEMSEDEAEWRMQWNILVEDRRPIPIEDEVLALPAPATVEEFSPWLT